MDLPADPVRKNLAQHARPAGAGRRGGDRVKDRNVLCEELAADLDPWIGHLLRLERLSALDGTEGLQRAFDREQSLQAGRVVGVVANAADRPFRVPGPTGNLDGSDVLEALAGALDPPAEVVEDRHGDDYWTSPSSASTDFWTEKSRTACLPSGTMKSDARQILADFLVREIGDESVLGWATKNGLPRKPVERAMKGATSVRIDQLQAFADALGVEVWQILFPGFERNAPQFPTMSVEAIDVARELDRIADEATRRRAYAAVMQLLEMVSGSLAAKDAPSEQPTPAAGPSPAPRRGS